MEGKDLYVGLVRLHVLHHAAQQPVYGGWIIDELRRHGYRLSPGTLYPMLHGLERKGYLKSKRDGAGRRARCRYAITAKGRAALADARDKVRELFGELVQGK